MHRGLKHIPGSEHTLAGTRLALGRLAMMVLETAQPVNLWRWVNSPTGKPLELGEKLCHPSLTTLAAIEQAIAGIALALGECDML
jgi:hypothetical protein